MIRQSLCRLSFVVAFIGLPFAALHAQNTLTLEGSVKGEGAPLTNAQVNVENIATHETANAVTRSTGEFRILGLFAGRYTVTVRSLGYKPERQTVELVIGQRARLEFNLSKGAAELATVTVRSEQVKEVEVQRLSVSSPVLQTEIENLPLNQRGIMNLAAVAPGIKTYAPQSGRTLPSGGAAPDLRFFNVYMDNRKSVV